jgi:predicted Ser/Thr protein kinase
MSTVSDHISKYEVIRRLGSGGMSTVYLARDPDLDRLLAVKVLREMMSEDEGTQRFLREARAAGNLRHENVITVYDAGQHEHQPFMAMEYVDGISLAELIRSRQPLSLADKLSYLEQICSGVHYAHSQGIVHRDIKPANLMVDRRNIVRILDFGIARVEGSGMTRAGELIGTLNYMSPEQMLGRRIDHRSDIFAVGTVAYELLAYEKAFPGTIQDGLLQRLPNEPPRPLGELCPDLPDGLEAAVTRALAKRPEERFADLGEVRTALRQIRRQLDPDTDVTVVMPPAGKLAAAAPIVTPAYPPVPGSSGVFGKLRTIITALCAVLQACAAGARNTFAFDMRLIAVATVLMVSMPSVGLRLTRVNFYASPYARITHLQLKNGEALGLPPQPSTPMYMMLRPGDYRVQFTGPDSKEIRQLRFRVTRDTTEIRLGHFAVPRFEELVGTAVVEAPMPADPPSGGVVLGVPGSRVPQTPPTGREQ